MAMPGVGPDEVDALAVLRDLAVRRATADEGVRRAARLAHDAAVDAGLGGQFASPPPRLRWPRWGWRRAIATAVERRMWTLDHAIGVRRRAVLQARATLRGEPVVFEGMAMLGRRVQVQAARDAGRVVIGPWAWLGDGSAVRCHEGQVVVGAKAVVGAAAVVNGWCDIDIGEGVMLGDWVYVCDFDHRTDRVDVPIRNQGIVVAPVRVGAGTWVGTKATILRGVDVGVGSVVGANAVVRDDLPPFSIAVGVPARVVRSRLAPGMDPAEAAALHLRGLAVPGDPLES